MFMACWALFNFAGAPSPLLVHQTANAVLWVGIWATYGDIGHGHGHVDADADGHLTRSAGYFFGAPAGAVAAKAQSRHTIKPQHASRICVEMAIGSGTLLAFRVFKVCVAGLRALMPPHIAPSRI